MWMKNSVDPDHLGLHCFQPSVEVQMQSVRPKLQLMVVTNVNIVIAILD